MKIGTNMNEPTFESYGLSNEILETLKTLHYDTPTPVQAQTIPCILKERDVLVKSQTGSGKTAAFAIPICESVRWEEYSPQALILEPTRELAVQVKEELFNIGRKKRLKVPVVFGGFPMDKQTLTLKQRSHILVGTPGRILDHLQRDTFSCCSIRYLVIDEADLMLNMGFLEQVTEILTFLPKDRITMLFSATLNDKLGGLTAAALKNPVSIQIESQTETAREIIQECYFVENEDKFEALIDLLVTENPESAIVFCGTREMTEVLYHKLKRLAIRCGMLHGLMDQKERLKTIEAFREGRFRFLTATDVAARGIDLDQISHVINYDVPTNSEDYVHRIGRTGRNGKSGKSITFFNSSEKARYESLTDFTNAAISIKELPAAETVKSLKNEFYAKQKGPLQLKKKKGAALNKEITRLIICGGKKSKLRAGDIVGTICSIPELTQDDIGIIDIRESLTTVEILNRKGDTVLDALQNKAIKGKLRKVQKDSR